MAFRGSLALTAMAAGGAVSTRRSRAVSGGIRPILCSKRPRLGASLSGRVADVAARQPVAVPVGIHATHISLPEHREERASVPVGSQPVSVALTPDGRSAYIADSGSDDVSVIDTRSKGIVRIVPTGRFPAGVAVTPDGRSVYVANEASADVTVIDTRSGAVEATIPAGAGPFDVATSSDGCCAFVAVLGLNELAAIDTRSRRLVSTASVGPYGTDPFNVAATDDAIYVTNQGANTLAVIDPRTHHVVTTVSVGNSPYGVAVDPMPRSVRTDTRS